MSNRIRVPDEEAQFHDLPPVSFSYDPPDSPVLLSHFPGPDTYLTFSGPPGGTLFGAVYRYPHSSDLVAALRSRLTVHVEQVGPPGTVLLAGEERPCAGAIYGTSHARSECCAVVFEAFPESLLVLVARGPSAAQSPDVRRLIEDTVVGPFLASFAVNN